MQRSTLVGFGVGAVVLGGLWWFFARQRSARTRAGRAVAAAPRVKVKASDRLKTKDEVALGRDAGPGVMYADNATSIAASSAGLATLEPTA